MLMYILQVVIYCQIQLSWVVFRCDICDSNLKERLASQIRLTSHTPVLKRSSDDPRQPAVSLCTCVTRLLSGYLVLSDPSSLCRVLSLFACQC